MESAGCICCYSRGKENGFLTELSRFYSDNTETMLIGGGFNIIRYASKKIEGMGCINTHICSIVWSMFMS